MQAALDLQPIGRWLDPVAPQYSLPTRCKRDVSSGSGDRFRFSSASPTWKRSCMPKGIASAAMCSVSVPSGEELGTSSQTTSWSSCARSFWSQLHPSSQLTSDTCNASWTSRFCRMTWDGFSPETARINLPRRYWFRSCRLCSRVTSSKPSTTRPPPTWPWQWWISLLQPGIRNCCSPSGLCWELMGNGIYNNGSGATPREPPKALQRFRLVSRQPRELGPRGYELAEKMMSNRGAMYKRQGCPGPNSGGIGAVTPVKCRSLGCWFLLPIIHMLHSPCVDARVGGSCGRSPPEAAPTCTAMITKQAKSSDPLQSFALCNAAGTRESQPDTEFIACFSVIVTHTRSTQTLLPSRTSKTSVQGHAPGSSRASMPCSGKAPSLIRLGQVCLLLAGCVFLAAFCASKPRRHFFSIVRVVPGIYRRRRTDCRPAKSFLPVSPVGLADHRRESCRGKHQLRLGSPLNPGLLFWFLGVLVVQTCNAMPLTSERNHLPTPPVRDTPTITAHGRLAQQLSFARKRSFRRAQQRALQYGSTQYRGRTHTPHSLQLRVLGSHSPRTVTPSIPNTCLRLLSWNAGGLHAGRYAELMEWLETEREQGRPVHIACVQETHWASDSEFSSGRWHCLHSGSGKSQAGILMLVNKEIATPQALRFTSLDAGRLFHVRVMREQVVDVLGVYQHAWQTQASAFDAASPQSQQLLHLRHRLWCRLRSWVRSIPVRNALVALGDFNCTLTSSPPNVGSGLAPHKHGAHMDQSDFQTLVQSLGLFAANTWGRPGRPAATFLQFNRHAVQIDYILLRLPCIPAERLAKAWQESPIVHPTGLRHVPVVGFLNSSTNRIHQPHPRSPKASEAHKALSSLPELASSFRCKVRELLPHSSIEESLLQAWAHCSSRQGAAPKAQSAERPRQSLKTYWDAKHDLRSMHSKLDQYWGPIVWYIADSGPAAALREFPSCARRLRQILHTWRSQIRFMREDKALRQRTRKSKLAQVNDLITQAELSAPQGLQGLYRLSRKLAPKSSKKSIHFRNPDGSLMTDSEELASLTSYFRELYRADLRGHTAWQLQAPMNIGLDEVLDALRQMSSRKALPPNQAPAVFWTTAQQELAPRICSDLNCALEAGPLTFPDSWHAAYMTLIPKPNKQPTQPANLRPICILPALPKLLARILASRLKPYVQQALSNTPQFAYLAQRQAADALDRAFAHCCRIRERLKGLGRSVFKLRAGTRESLLEGGLTLSLDLSKAYDRLPRSCLLESLQLMDVPADLLSVIMHIHDTAYVVLRRHDLESQAPLGQGIRQGCGLSPLLWIGYTLLIFHRLQPLVPPQSLTGYADDFLVNWEVSSPRDFTNACNAIPKILNALQDLGMSISLDKTVILLAIKGRAAPQLLKTYVCHKRSERFLRLTQGTTTTLLPINSSHTYLGAKIGYGLFERETAQFRLSQAWVAFHRLHPLLKQQSVPLNRRLQLWLTCVWTITRYGLSSTGLDSHSALKLSQNVYRQLRVVARSPAHVSHEDNAHLLRRLGVTHPLHQLAQATQKRIALSRTHVGHMQPAHVTQWWDVVLSSLYQHAPDVEQKAHLIEVSQLFQARHACQDCGQTFPTHHALQVHRGKSHQAKPPHRQPPAQTDSKPRRNDEQHRCHALHGMPTCKHCLRSFHGWPEFSGHFTGFACPVLHSSSANPLHNEPSQPLADGASAPERSKANDTDPEPLFYRTDLQTLAEGKRLKQLAMAIRTSGRLQFCPECGQWCTKSTYLARHANKLHPHMASHQQAIREWAQRKTRLSQPCEWCGVQYGTRPATHLQNCPVLWMCGHFFLRHASLADTGQTSLAASFQNGRAPYGDEGEGRTPASTGGVRAVRPIHEGGDPGHQPAIDSGDQDPCKLNSPPTQEEMDVDRDKRTTAPPQLEPPSKWAKGEAKGEPRPEVAAPLASGKGPTGDQMGKAGLAPPARDHQNSSGSVLEAPTPNDPTSTADTKTSPGTSAPQALAKTNNQGSWGGWRGGNNRGWNSGQERSQNRSRRGTDDGRWGRDRHDRDRDREQEMEELREMIRHLARLALRLEDAMSICNLDNEFILFFQTGANPWSITTPLFTTATEWKAKKESNPESLSQPLRSVLFYCVWASLLTQLRKMEEPSEEEFINTVKGRGLTEDNSWLYLKWNNQTRKHEKDAQDPLEHVTAVQLVQQIMMLCTYPDTLGRFHALRPLTSNLSSDVIPFLLTLQNRTQESHQLYTCVRRLCRNSCTHLVGMTLRPSRLGRSPLAQQIDRLLKHI